MKMTLNSTEIIDAVHFYIANVHSSTYPTDSGKTVNIKASFIPEYTGKNLTDVSMEIEILPIEDKKD